MGIDEEYVIGVANLEVEALAQRHAMGVDSRDGDWTVSQVGLGRHAGDHSGMGIDAEACRQCTREGQGVAGGGSHEVAGNVEREALAFIAALICDRCRRRTAVADLEVKSLADRHAMGVGSRHRNRVVRGNRRDGE